MQCRGRACPCPGLNPEALESIEAGRDEPCPTSVLAAFEIMKSIGKVCLLVLIIVLIALPDPEPTRARVNAGQGLKNDPAGRQSLLEAGRQSRREARRREIAARARDERYLLLRAGAFDPLSRAPETTELPAKIAQLAARAESERGYFIVQYQSAITPSQTAELRAAGHEIVGYIAHNAYIVRTTAAGANRLATTQNSGRNAGNALRWVGAYGPALKVDPELSHLASEITASRSLSSSTAASDLHFVSFVTFHGENAERLRATLGSLGIDAINQTLSLEERSDGRCWGVQAVRRADLPALVSALAGIEGIEWIEERTPRRPHNDNLVRIIQTGVAGADTPLYRHGLTGMGQIYATADTGLDSDHSQFRLSGNATAQTLSFATSTAALSNGLLPARVTNQGNKVLTYYLLGASGFIDRTENPHGGRTLDPDRRSGTRFLNAVAYDDAGAGYHGTLTTSVAVGRNFGANGSGALPGIPTRSRGDGIAPDASIVFQDVGHPDGSLPGVDFVSQMLIHLQAYSTGARVHNNSYGPELPVAYDQDAADIDEAMWRLRDYTIFFSAGNDSPGRFQVTSVAKNNIVVGATEGPTSLGRLEDVASYSNHGPTFDGRLKPDIVAPGSVIGATEDEEDDNDSSYGNATSATAKDAAVNPDDPNNSSTIAESAASGTSFASAAAAGAALLVRQYFTDGFYPGGARNSGSAFTPSNALVKAVLLNSGRNLTGRFTARNFPASASGSLPNAAQGWGRIALDDALYFAGDRRELRILADIYNGATAADASRPAPQPAITTGVMHTYQLTSVSNVEPLRITLAWSDPRAAVSSAIALVNDLDLEVTDPEGRVWRGNANFQNGWSQPADGADYDRLNPVEAVYIERPSPGTYTVRIIGANVPGNGQMMITAEPGNQQIDSNRQGYALIATGNFTAGAQSVLSLGALEVGGGVNADPFIGRNETVTARARVINSSALAASNVVLRVEVDADSQVPASVVRIDGKEMAEIAIGDLAPGAERTIEFPITLLDDGEDRVGAAIVFRATMTPAGGLDFITRFTILAQLKLITYRTRFEPEADPGGPGVIVIPESEWRLRKDHDNKADDEDPFSGNWPLTAEIRAGRENSTASLSDPSGPGAGYGTSETSRPSGLVFDDTRWWSPKIALPGLRVTESTGLVANPEDAALLKAEIDSFEIDVKADFSGDVSPAVGAGDFAVLRLRTYRNTSSIRSTDDSGANEASFTNLVYLDANTVAGTDFIHYSGRNFASGDGRFTIDESEDEEDEENESDVFFRLELQLRRNSFPQSGDGVFFDNLVVRLRVADRAVYAAPGESALASVDAASYRREIAPGAIVAAFGRGFPAGTNINEAARELPLPTTLADVAVRVNGIDAPLFFVGAGGALGEGNFQINYQLPFETAPGSAEVEVLVDGRLVASEFVRVSAAAAGVFTFSATGEGQAAALNEDFSLNGDPSVNPAAQPVERGRFLILYATGQGRELLDPVTRELRRFVSGFPAPADPLFVTAETPAVSVGGVPAEVAYSGLAPGFVGAWQLNILIPAGAPTGAAVPVVISYGGRESRVTTIAIR